MFMRKSLQEYMDQYAAEHTQLGTKITHFIGIPMIVASLPILPFNPPVGGALFATGWALQILGHAVFEKSKPSFFEDPFYLLVGPIWVAKEMAQLIGFELPLPGVAPHETPADHAEHAASSFAN
jgi:uncharacterized membrane protein YGL010W